MESFYLHRDLALNLSKGFTLVELVVVTAIIGVIMSIVFTNQSAFNKTLMLKNTAYDIALTLRNAQTFGLGSRAQGASPNDRNVGYGVHFSKGTPSSFILFADTIGVGCHTGATAGSPDYQPGNCSYDAVEKIVEYKIGNGIIVNDLCLGTSCGGNSSLDVVFARPNTETFITGGASSACIEVYSPQGGTKNAVKVTSAGQIIANAASCP